jgi:integrase
MKMSDILPTHVREWVRHLSAQGVSPAHVRHLKVILSAIFTTALNDFVVALHPCRGVKTPTAPIRSHRIVTPEEYLLLGYALPTETARLFVDVDMGSGLRWGEITELRPHDIHFPSGILTVSRAVVELNPTLNPEGIRFHVKPYPKNKRPRRLKLDPELIAGIQAHVERNDIADHDLLFQFDHFQLPPRPPPLIDASTLGLTEPNGNGRQYAHGTLSAYTAGHCRCDHCRSRFARYRAQRRAAGHDSPRARRIRDTDGHVRRDWYRFNVWYPSCKTAQLDPRPTMQDIRHSHASWLLAGGADLQVVRERLGHASIATTSKYLHTLPNCR